MRPRLLLPLALVACAWAYCADFEDAQSAVANMRIGWNAGNRLDANSGDKNSMWIEAFSQRDPKDYETAWGQPQISRELVKMFKDAGFNTIRVPVTWYPHMGNVAVEVKDGKGVWDMGSWSGYDIDPAWMARVHEVVDYVIDEGMYCIINVHHDTGEASTAWLRANTASYNVHKERFEALWTSIANEFKDYGERLLFEGYNEMLDNLGSWCFASFAYPGNYSKISAADSYEAINSYAQTFVDAVRATGGNNEQRNLIVNTYGACSGDGDWNAHLQDPLTQMQIPADAADGHLALEVHYYPYLNNIDEAQSAPANFIANLKANTAAHNVPLVIGEWGVTTPTDHPDYQSIFCAFAKRFVEITKDDGIATMLWMVLADGNDCLAPRWSNGQLKDAIVEGYYGEGGFQGIAGVTIDQPADGPIYNLQGIKVAEPLCPGLYIKDGKKFLVK